MLCRPEGDLEQLDPCGVLGTTRRDREVLIDDLDPTTGGDGQRRTSLVLTGAPRRDPHHATRRPRLSAIAGGHEEDPPGAGLGRVLGPPAHREQLAGRHPGREIVGDVAGQVLDRTIAVAAAGVERTERHVGRVERVPVVVGCSNLGVSRRVNDAPPESTDAV